MLNFLFVSWVGVIIVKAQSNTTPCNAIPLTPITVPSIGSNAHSTPGGWLCNQSSPGNTGVSYPCQVGQPQSLWYSFVATGTSAHITTSNSGTTYDTYMGLFTGPCTNPSYTGHCNDDGPASVHGCSACSPFYCARLTPTNLVPGTTYYIRIDSYDGTCPVGQMCIRVEVQCAAPPQATITGPTPAQVCVGQNTQVQGNTVTGATYTWNCDGCTTAPPNTPGPHNLSWSTPGTKTVTFSVDQPGCPVSTATVLVTVNPTPTSSFTASPTTVCTGSNVSLTYTGSAPTGSSFNWSCGGCSPVPTGPTATVSWSSAGTYTVSLTVTGPAPTNCASTTSTVAVTVNLPPTPVFTATGPVCSEQTSTVTLTSPSPIPAGDTYTWSCDGCSPAIPANQPGPHNVSWVVPPPNNQVKTISLTYNRPGCNPVVVTQTVNVKPIPTSTFTAAPANGTSVCAGNQTAGVITYTGSLGSPPHTFTWNCDMCTGGNPATQGPHNLSWANGGIKTLSLQVESGGCVSSTTTQTLVVHDIPTSSFTTSSTSICEGATITWTYTGTLGTPPHVYSWDCAGCDQGSPSTAGPHTISWGSHGYRTISLTVSSNNCSSTTTTQVIEVNKVPTSNFSIGPSQVCADNNNGPITVSTNFNPATNFAGSGTGATSATYNWNCDGCNGGNPTTAGPHSLSWSTSGTKTVTLQVINNPSGCASGTTSVLVTVHPVPTAPTFTPPFQRCGPGILTLTATPGTNGTTIRWYASANAVIPSFTDVSFTTSFITTTTTYYISSYNSNTQCEGAKVPIVAVINPFPGAPSAPPIARCGPGVVTFTATNGVPPGDELRLYTVPTGGTPIATTVPPSGPLTTPQPVTTTTQYYVSSIILATGCETRTPVSVTIHPIPAAPTTQDESRCDPGVVNFFAAMNNPAGTQINLYSQPNCLTPIDVDFTSPFMVTTPFLTTTDSFYVAAVNSVTGCSSPCVKVRAFIYPNPQFPTANNLSRCGTGPVVITATYPGNSLDHSIHLYSQPSGGNPLAIAQSAPFTLQTPSITQNTVFYIEAVNVQTICKSGRIPVSVTVHPIPGLPLVKSEPICGFGNVVFSVTPTGNTLGDLFRLYATSPGGPVLDSDSSTPYELSTTVSTTTTFFIEAEVQATGCTSSRVAHVAEVLTIPAPPISADVKRCGPGEVVISASMSTPAGQGMKIYTQPNGGLPILDLSNSNGDYRFHLMNVLTTTTFYVESYIKNCGSVRTPVVVTINPLPTPPTSSNLTRCGGGSFTFSVTLSNDANVVRLYTIASGGNWVAQDDGAPYFLTSPEVQASTIFYIASLNTSSGCESIRIPYTATVYPIPGIPSAANVKRCDVGPVTFTANMGVPAGDVLTLYDSQNTLITQATSAPYFLTASVQTTSTFFIESSNSVTGCVGGRVAVIATINPTPAPAAPIASNIVICGGGVATFSVQMGNPPGDMVLLYATPVGGNPLASDAIVPYELTTPSLTVSKEFYLESLITGTGCASVRVPVNVNVVPRPDVPLTSNVSRCGEGIVTFTLSMGNISGDEVRLYTQFQGSSPFSTDAGSALELTTPPVSTTTTFYVTSYSSITNCESAKLAIVAEVKPIPGVPTVGNNKRCGQGPVTLTAVAGFPAGNEIRLYEVPQGGPLIAMDNTAPYVLTLSSVATSKTVFVSVYNSNTNCEGPRLPVHIEINPIPASPQVADVQRCGAGPVQFTALMVAPEGNQIRIYTTLSSSSPILEDNSSPFELYLPYVSTTSIYYVESNNTITGCSSVRTPVSAVILATPEAPVALDIVRCGAGSVFFTASISQTLGTVVQLYETLEGGAPIAIDAIEPYVLQTPEIGQTTTYYIGVKNTVSNCESERTPVVATIHPVPAPPIVGATQRCGVGSATIFVNLGASAADVIRLYEAPSGGTWLDEDFSNPYELKTPVIGQNTTYFVSAENIETGCKSSRVPVTVTVHPLPGAPLSSDISRCGPGSATITAIMSGTPGTEIRLYNVPNGGSPLVVSNFSPHHLLTPALSASQYFYLASFSQISGCESQRTPVLITINPIPGEPTAVEASRCGAGAISFIVQSGIPAGNEMRLYTSLDDIVPFAVDNTPVYELVSPVITTTTTFFISSVNTATGCESIRRKVIGKVLPPPPPPRAQNETRCGSGSITVYVESNSVQGQEVRLYNAAQNGYIVATDNSNPYELTTGLLAALNTTNTYTFYISTFNPGAGCESPLVPVIATVYQAPAAPTVNSVSRCGPGTVKFTATMNQPAGDGIRMYGSLIDQEPIDQVYSQPWQLVTPNLLNNATFFFAAYNTSTGCESPRVSAEVFIYPIPALPNINHVKICGSGRATFTVNINTPIEGEILLYNAAVGGSPLATATTSPYYLTTPIITTSSIFFVVLKNKQTGCESLRQEVRADVLPKPDKPTAFEARRCGAGEVIITAQMGFIRGSEIRLYTQPVGGNPIDIDNTETYELKTPVLLANMDFYIESASASTGCQSDRTLVNVQVFSTPGLPLSGDVGRCGPGSVIISASQSAPAGNEIRLYDAPVAGNLVSMDNNPPYELTTPNLDESRIFYLVAYNSQTGCFSPPKPINVVIHPLPGAPAAEPVSRCGSGSVVITARMGVPAGNILRLYAGAIGGSPISSVGGAPFLLTSFPITTTTTFYLESFNTQTGCASPRTLVGATVHPLPGPPSVQSVGRCGVGVVEFSPLMGLPEGTEMRLYAAAVGGETLQRTTLSPYILSAAVSSTTSFYVAVYNQVTGCESERVLVTAQVNPLPGVPFAASVSRCNPGNVTLTAVMGVPSGNMFRIFTLENGGIPIATAVVGSSNLEILNIQTTTTFYLESYNNLTTCASNRKPVVVTIGRNPGTPEVITTPRCGPGRVEFKGIMGTPAGSAIRLFSLPNGGEPLSVAETSPYLLYTPIINTTTTYYVDVIEFITGCSSSRREVEAVIFPLPSAPQVVNAIRCGPGSFTLSAFPNSSLGNELRLYVAAHASEYYSSANSSPYKLVTPEVTTTTSFYISAYDATTSCESEKVPVLATVVPIPGPPVASPASRCGPGIVTITAVMGIPQGNSIELFSEPMGGDPISMDNLPPYELSTPIIQTSTVFYLESISSLVGCRSVRIPVKVEVHRKPAMPQVSSVFRCGSGEVIFMPTMAAPLGNQMRLYSQLNAITPLEISASSPFMLRTPTLATTTTFYISSFNTQTGCESDRKEIEAIVRPVPGAPSAADVSRCGGGAVTITAAPGNPGANVLRLYDSPSGGTVLSQANTAPYLLTTPEMGSSGVLYVSAYDSETGCEGPRSPVQVNIYDAPPAPVVSSAKRCGTGSVTFTFSHGISVGYVYRLYTQISGGGAIAEATPSNPLLTTPLISTTTIFFLENYSSATSCASHRVPLTATVEPQPGAPIVQGLERCGPGSFRITAQMGIPPGNGIRLFSVPQGGQPLTVDNTPPYEFLIPNLNTTTVFYVASYNGECSSNRTPVNLIINPVPVISTVQNDGPKCPGQVLTLTAVGSPQATYMWQGPNNFFATGATVTRILNSSLDAGIYSVTAILGNCSSFVYTTTVSFTDLLLTPNATFYNQFGASVPLCVGDELNLAVSNFEEFPIGTRFEWIGPSYYLPASDHPQPVIPSVDLINEGVYYVRAIINGCTSTANPVTVRIYPRPKLPTASNSGPYCEGKGKIELFASPEQDIAQYIWVGPNGFSTTGSYITRPAETQNAGVYSLTVVSNYGCRATGYANTTVHIYSNPPKPNIDSNTRIICAGQQLRLTTGGVIGAEYLWQGPNNFALRSGNLTVFRNEVSLADSGIYSVRAISNGCTSEANTIKINIIALPEQASLETVPNVCVGSTVTLVAKGSEEDIRYIWQGPEGFSAEGATVVIDSIQLQHEGVYTVIPERRGCRGLASSTTVFVYPKPELPILATNSPVCAGKTLHLSAAVPENVSVYWQGPHGFFAVGPFVVRQNVLAEHSGEYSAVAVVNGCTSVAAKVEVVVRPLPSPPTATNSGPECPGGTAVFRAWGGGNANYRWIGPNRFIAQGAEVLLPGVTTASAGVYQVVAIVEGCTSSPATTLLEVFPRPSAPSVVANSPVCVGETIFLNASGVQGATYRWIGPNGFSGTGNSLQVPATSLATGGIYSAVAIVGSCTSEVATVGVQIKNRPPMPVAGHNAPRCLGDQLILTASGLTGSAFEWSGPANFNASGTPVTRMLTSLLHAGVYRVRAIRDGCASAWANVLVQFQEAPATPSIIHNGPKCIGEILVLSVNSTTSNASYMWQGPNGFSSSGASVSRLLNVISDGGIYSVIAIAGGCSSLPGSTYVQVIQRPEPPLVLSNGPLCVGQTLLLTAVPMQDATFEWSGPAGFSATGLQPSLPNVTTTNAGTYEVIARVGGCRSAAASIEVSVFPKPGNPVAASNGPICAGATLQLHVNSIAGANYLWTGPGGFSSSLERVVIPDAKVEDSGDYTVIAFIGSCTSSPSAVRVTVMPRPATPTVSSAQTICAGSTLQLTASSVPGAIYSWVGPNGYFTAVQNPIRNNVTTSDAGTYTVRTILGNCSSGTASVDVTIVQRPPTPQVGSNSPICAGMPLQLTASSLPGVTYDWSGPVGFVSNAQNPQIISTTTQHSGTYTIVVRIGDCQAPPVTVRAEVRPAPGSININTNSPICSGNILQLVAPQVAGASYLWRGPNNFSSIQSSVTLTNANVVNSGIYTLVVSIGNCSSVSTTHVQVNPTPPSPGLSSNSPICAGESLRLSATTIPDAEYFWSGPAAFTSTEQNPVISNAQIGGEFVAYTRIGGCTSAAARIRVTVNPSPGTITASSNSPVCSGGAVHLNATFINSATYLWSGPFGYTSTLSAPTINNATTLNSGIYTVVARIGNCESRPAVTTVTVQEVPSIAGIGNNGPLCAGATLRLTAQAPIGVRYLWSGPNGFGSSMQNPVLHSIPSSAAGTYSLIVVQGNCTSRVATTQLVIRPTPNSPLVSTPPPVCEGEQVRLVASEINNATYLWNGPLNFSSSLRQVTLQNVRPAMAGNYEVVAILEGCTSTSTSVQVVINPKPVIQLVGSNSPLCQGQTLNLTASFIPGASYEWRGPRFSSTEPTPVITNVKPEHSGTYFVTASLNGCVSETQALEVQVHPVPQNVTASSNSPICIGQGELQLIASFVPGASYSWMGPAGYFSNEQNPTIANPTTLNSGSYTVTVNLGICSTSVSTEVLIGHVPQNLMAGSNSPVCEGQTLALTAESILGARYIWVGPNNFTSNSQNPIISDVRLSNAGIYSVVAIIGNCTSSVATVRVQVNAAPLGVMAGNSGPVCSGQTLSLFVTPVLGATYRWSGPNGFTSTLQNPTISGVTSIHAGAYQVLVQIGSCSLAPLVTHVEVNPTPPPVFATNSSPACIGNKVQLFASSIPGASYAWFGPNGYSSSEQNPEILNISTAQAGTYSVIARLGNCNSPVSPTTVVVRDFNLRFTAGSNSPICEGDTLRLLAPQLEGASYFWQGPQGFSSTIANARIPMVSLADSGSYSLTITMNGCPSKMETTRVVIRRAPALPEVYTNAPICWGGTIQLTAIAEVGSSYHWSGPNNFASTSSQVYISRATSLHAGVYTLRSFKEGCYSAPASVFVPVHHPHAEFINARQLICIGSAAQFDIHLEGQGPWNINYLENNQPRFLTINSSPYVVPVMVTQNTNYRLVSIIDKNGCEVPLSATKDILIAPLPQASIPSSISICPGDEAVLPVTITEVNANTLWALSYRLGNGPIMRFDGQGSGVFNLNIGRVIQPTVLQLISIENTTQGCRRGLNGIGTTSNIVFHNLPTAAFNSPNRLICSGEQISGSIELTGNGPWLIEYLENGQLKTVTTSTRPLNLHVSPTTTTTYTLRSVSDASGCVNRIGSEWVVEVRSKPTFRLSTPRSAICMGDTAKIGISVSGVAPWTLEYTNATMNEPPITLGSRGQTFYAGELYLSPGITTEYQFLRVTDANGCTQELLEPLRVEVNPVPQLRLVTVNAAVCGTGYLKVEASGGSKSNYFYKLGAIENTSGEFTNLAPGLYYVTASDGICPSATLPVQVSPAEPPVVTHLQALEGNSISVRWEPIWGVASYSVRYRKLGTNEWRTQETSTSSIILSGLQGNTSYEVEVRYNCARGASSEWRSAGVVTTQNISNCSVPQNLDVTLLSNNSAQVGWQSLQAAICYAVSWGPLNEPMNTWNIRLVPAPSTSYQITGLEPTKQYGVRVRANCSQCSVSGGNLSEWSNSISLVVPASKVSFEDEQEPLVFSVYPNPTQGAFTLEYLAKGHSLNLRITDLLGNTIIEKQFSLQSQSGLIEVDVHHLPTGVYLVHCGENGYYRTLKLMKR
ncbi:MAG: fibronectin type III domain-containing protein [Bacteroidia bacterium]|nr:fibronectin type III domain-containing protein [Bacteroidia bacterium]